MFLQIKYAIHTTLFRIKCKFKKQILMPDINNTVYIFASYI